MKSFLYFIVYVLHWFAYDIKIHVRLSLPNHVSSSGVMWMELDDSFNLEIIDPIKAAKIPNECRLAAKAMYT